jgi:hypothetical protein
MKVQNNFIKITKNEQFRILRNYDEPDMWL